MHSRMAIDFYSHKSSAVYLNRYKLHGSHRRVLAPGCPRAYSRREAAFRLFGWRMGSRPSRVIGGTTALLVRRFNPTLHAARETDRRDCKKRTPEEMPVRSIAD